MLSADKNNNTKTYSGLEAFSICFLLKKSSFCEFNSLLQNQDSLWLSMRTFNAKLKLFSFSSRKPSRWKFLDYNLPDYPGVSQICTKLPGRLYGSTNLLDKHIKHTVSHIFWPVCWGNSTIFYAFLWLNWWSSNFNNCFFMIKMVKLAICQILIIFCWHPCSGHLRQNWPALVEKYQLWRDFNNLNKTVYWLPLSLGWKILAVLAVVLWKILKMGDC